VAESRQPTARRILFITHVGEPGGAELQMINICRLLRDSAEVLLFQHGSLEGMLSQQRIRFSVQEIGAAARNVRREDGVLRLLKAVPGVLSLARRVARKARAFDVVVCFSQKSFVLASLSMPLVRRPIFWFMNDILSTAHFSRTLIRFLVTLSRYSAAHIAVNSCASLDSWVRSGGRQRAVSVIYPSVAEEQIAAQLADPTLIAAYRSKYSPDGRPLVGMFGRISRWKGQDVFLRAVAQLPEVNAVIVGGALFGEEELERNLKSLARDLGVERRVRFVGHINDVMTLMAACDVVAHCSTAPEPFGLVIAEAMLAGAPVVASDAGGAREIVIPGETGQLTPLRDHDALAAAVRNYIDNPRWSRDVAARARQRAQAKFSRRAMESGFLAVLETL
jgi:glycosyltransferase involved in cell wall biosynthesis